MFTFFFIILKFFGVLDLSWWWIFFPLFFDALLNGEHEINDEEELAI